MKKLSIIIFFLSLFISHSYGQNKKVDDFILSEMKEVGIQGASVAVVKWGRIVKMQSYGTANLEWSIPTTNNTLFPMASVSKLFTSSLIADMVRNNELDLDAPITKYIKDAPYTWEAITIKHILSHTSGIKWLKNIDHNATTKEAIESLKDSTLMFKPGTKECYASSDYTVLKFIVENVTTKTFEDLMKERVFSKVGMNGCGYDMEKRKGCEQTMIPLKHKTQVYLGKNDDMKVYKYFYPRYSYCAGGLWMNIQDACSWVCALDRGILFTQDDEVLLYEKAENSSLQKSNFSIYGWNANTYQNHKCAGISGGPAVAEILRFPENKLTVIVFTNQRNILPYLAKSIATFYMKGLHMPNGRKTLEF